MVREPFLCSVAGACISQKPQHCPNVPVARQQLPGRISGPCPCLEYLNSKPLLPLHGVVTCRSSVLTPAARDITRISPRGPDLFPPCEALFEDMLSVLPTLTTPPALVRVYPSRRLGSRRGYLTSIINAGSGLPLTSGHSATAS